MVGQDRLAFSLSNEVEVEEGQEGSGLDDGAHAADLRRLDKIRAQERHRNVFIGHAENAVSTTNAQNKAAKRGESVGIEPSKCN
jgi:hypothetical protein